MKTELLAFVWCGSALMACDGSNGTPAVVDDAADTAVADTVASEPDSDAASDSSQPVDSATAADTAVAEDVVTTGKQYSLGLGGWTMQPTDETTRCVIKRLDNDEPILVHRIATRLSKGSHHLIVYTSAATEERLDPFPCAPFTEALSGGTVPLVISQIREDAVELPPGVAYELQPHQMIRLEAHYLNYYTEPITADVAVTFETLEDSDAVQRADILFYGTLDIFLPKDAEVTTPWVWYGVPAGLHIFSMTGHTHALGTNVEVERSASKSTAGDALYPPAGTPFDWQEAPVARFDPPLDTTAGDGFRFRCSWHNTSGHAVMFGESATSEMCFFWAYYYPSQGPIIRF
ncbi:MAG: hypothetical protein U1F43_34630 [Myxococcota bacterium]